MKDAVDEMRSKDAHIVIWTETHFDQKHSLEFERIAQDGGYNTYSITRLMRRHDTGSGGVTVMIDKQYNSREVRKSKLEDLIWVRVDIGREKIFVGGTYLVPASSSRGRKAEQLVEEIGTDVARFTQEGQVVVAGDWNCKIACLASIASGREFDRRNMSDKPDKRGRRVVELLNRSGMVILNGIRGSIAQNTYEGASSGVNDYIAVSAELVEKTSNIEYWTELQDTLHTDHCGIACTTRIETQGEGENRSGEGRGEKVGKAGYGIVGRIRSEQYWAWLEEGRDV